MKLKKLILSLSAMMSLMIGSISQAYAVTWRTDFKQATEDAKQQHKLVLLKFSGSDWCLPCIRMEKDIFSQDTFNNFAAEHLVMVNADFPHKKTGKELVWFKLSDSVT